MPCPATRSGALPWAATATWPNQSRRLRCFAKWITVSVARPRATFLRASLTSESTRSRLGTRAARRVSPAHYLCRMPIVPFDSLPDSARVWVFGSDRPIPGAPADSLLAAVDQFLSEWKAHGVPLRSGRDWREDRFLAIGVDVTQENASGCSIDGLFRTLQVLEREIGARLVGGGRVFYRTAGRTEVSSRDAFEALI